MTRSRVVARGLRSRVVSHWSMVGGQHKYMPILLERIERGEIDPSFIITHRIGLEDAPSMYRTFRDKHDSCIKVVMKPGASTTTTEHRSPQA